MRPQGKISKSPGDLDEVRPEVNLGERAPQFPRNQDLNKGKKFKSLKFLHLNCGGL